MCALTPSTAPDPESRLHVAAAVLVEPDGRVVVARRHAHQHQGGLWEFPGGKVESGERAEQALRRELDEELALTIDSIRPLITVAHDYPDRRVLLDVWHVEAQVTGSVGREGQPLRRLYPAELQADDFPAGNYPIILAARLPERYLITPDPGPREQWPAFLAQLEACLARGYPLVQLRAKSLDNNEFKELAKACLGLVHRYGARLLLNSEPELVEAIGADGVHLSSPRLTSISQRPLPEGLLVGASCHDVDELRQAEELRADFALLSPVKATISHPDSPPLGWSAFAGMTRGCGLPIYALGGLGEVDLADAWRHGGQGVAAISGFWKLCGENQ